MSGYEEKIQQELGVLKMLKASGLNTYGSEVSSGCGPTMMVEGKERINFISNSYMGFSMHPKVGYHGGVGLEEVVVPAVWLKEGTASARVEIRFIDVPGECTEDQEITITVELSCPNTLGVTKAEIWLP